MTKEQIEKIRDDLAKSRATQVEIKFKIDPRLTVFDNANLSFKKGFDAGIKQAELEIENPQISRKQLEDKIKMQNQIIEKLLHVAEYYADQNNWEQGESYAELSRIADNDLQYFVANRGHDIIGGKFARGTLETIQEISARKAMSVSKSP